MAELQKGEKKMIGMAGGCLLFFIVHQFVCADNPNPPQTAAGPSVHKVMMVEAGARKNNPESPGSTGKNYAADRVKHKSLNLVSWKRDPFAETFRLATPDTTSRKLTDLKLTGIIRRGNRALALIGNRILREGQSSDGLKIIKINKDRVLCKRGAKLITLLLEND